MKTSIVTVVYNRPKHLKACLRAIQMSSVRPDELVVSDDGSCPEAVDEMAAFFKDYFMPVEYVRQEHSGFRAAAARNQAIRRSTGDYLIAIDCDIILLPDAISAHLTQAKPGRFLAGNRAFLDQSLSRQYIEEPLSAESLEEMWRLADRSHLSGVSLQFNRNKLLRKIGLASRHKPKLIGCHFSIFRDDIYRVNGFDENFVGWGLEDDDLSLRLHRAGVEGKSVILESRAIHLHHDPVESFPKEHSEIQSMSYFKRRSVPAYCERGLA